MKKLKLFFLISVIILAASFNNVNATSKRDLPYEISEIKINNSKKTLEISGWAFITGAQSFINDKTHQYKLYLLAEDDTIEIIGKNKDVSHTATMHYVGSRNCGIFEFNKAIFECNHTYDKVGFNFEIPLDLIKLDQNYQVKLEVWAKMADVKKTISVYFPINERLTLVSGQKQLTVNSNIDDLSLEVLFNHVIVRDMPGKTGKIMLSKNHCSDNNYLYYKNGATFHKIFDKQKLNNLTYYKLGGKEDLCINGYALMAEGSDIYPVWIASNFIQYHGPPLTISTSLFNVPPLISVKNNPTIYVNEKVDIMEGVSAYDYEDGDLTSKIIIASNSFENKPGVYKVVYAVTDKDMATSKAVKYITVLAKNFPPVINAHDIEISQYAAYNPYANVSAVDQDGTNITSKVKTTTTVDTAVAQPQLQCYSVTDDYNLTTNKCIVVNVIKAKSNFRFIDKNNLFYLEAIPLNWINRMNRLELEVSNQISYIKRTIST